MTEKIGSRATPDRELRATITAAIKRSPLKRSVICERLTEMVGVPVSESMLNDFTSHSKKGVRFPLLFSAALCEILDDDSVGLLGVRPSIRARLEFAERELRAYQDQREREELRNRVMDTLSREEFAKRRKVRGQSQQGVNSQTALPLGEPK